MKSFGNFPWSLLNANVPTSTKGFIKKNSKLDLTVNQHQHMICIIVSKQIK